MRRRDSQRRKLYAAEREAFRNDPLADVRLTEFTARELIATVQGSRFWRERYPQAKHHTKFRLNRKRGGAVAWYYGNEIEAGSHATQRWVIIHELAHMTAPHPVSHGRDFAKAYLELVEKFLSYEHYRALKAAFVKHKVRHRGTDAAHLRRIDQKAASKCNSTRT